MKDLLPRLRACRQSIYANWPEDDLVRISGRLYVKKLPSEHVSRAKSNADDIFSLVNTIKSPTPSEPGQENSMTFLPRKLRTVLRRTGRDSRANF